MCATAGRASGPLFRGLGDASSTTTTTTLPSVGGFFVFHLFVSNRPPVMTLRHSEFSSMTPKSSEFLFSREDGDWGEERFAHVKAKGKVGVKTETENTPRFPATWGRYSTALPLCGHGTC